jgi:hypothetical protein
MNFCQQLGLVADLGLVAVKEKCSNFLHLQFYHDFSLMAKHSEQHEAKQVSVQHLAMCEKQLEQHLAKHLAKHLEEQAHL